MVLGPHVVGVCVSRYEASEAVMGSLWLGSGFVSCLCEL